MLGFVRRHPIWAALIALAVLIGLSFFVPLYGQICEKNPYTGDKECATYYIAFVVFRYLGDALEAHAGAVTGVATVILAYITWSLVRLGQEQARAQRIQLRAYVFVETTSLFDGATPINAAHFSATGCPNIRGVIRNFGQTPAVGVRIFAEIVAVPAATLNDAPNLPADDIIRASPRTSFGPTGGTSFERNLGRALTAFEVGSLANVGMTLIVRGKIIYKDVFGIEQMTEFNLGWAGEYPPVNAVTNWLYLASGNRHT